MSTLLLAVMFQFVVPQLVVPLEAAWPFATDVADDAIVARATQGELSVTITAARLRAYAEQQPDRAPRALAEELIEFELLAAEARRQGLDSARPVRDAAERAMVKRMLIVDFESKWSADALPPAMVKESYQRNISQFVRPELRVGDHLLATTATSKRPTDPAQDAAARALLETVRADLEARPPADRDAFRARIDAFQDAAKAAGITLRAEMLTRFALKGQFVPAFSKAMFDVPAVGAMTPVFATTFGWHLGRIEAIEAPINRSLAEAGAELRARIVPEVRPAKFRELTETLGRQSNALMDLGPLERQAQRRGL
ncbi:MAG: peptidyl-prolyl cis-trans isomerase C [Bradymonadia bacterium]|jgi:peptidyl-prolyl cis-trans isomerase C